MLEATPRGFPNSLVALALALGPSCGGPLERTSGPKASAAATFSAKPAPPAASAAVAALPAVPADPQQKSEPPSEPGTFELAAGGDVGLGRACGQAILQDPKYDPFRFIAPIWSKADLRFVNLESQLSDQKGETQSPRHHLIFCGPPGGADVLARAGIGVVSTANNHAWDYGRAALFETLANLERAGVKSIGTGRTLDQALTPAEFEVRGHKIALFAVSHVWNQGPMSKHEARNFVGWARFADLRQKIARARRDNDFVVLSYHGGEEYIDAPVDRTRAFVKEVMAAGVDVFIGHHPHVPQGVGWYGGRPVFYSLGNFVFDSSQNRYWTKFGMVAKLELRPDHSIGVRVCPYGIEGHTPKPLAQGSYENQRFRRSLKQWSTAVGGSEVGETDANGCYPLAAPKPRSPRPVDPPRVDRGSGPLARR